MAFDADCKFLALDNLKPLFPVCYFGLRRREPPFSIGDLHLDFLGFVDAFSIHGRECALRLDFGKTVRQVRRKIMYAEKSSLFQCQCERPIDKKANLHIVAQTESDDMKVY